MSPYGLQFIGNLIMPFLNGFEVVPDDKLNTNVNGVTLGGNYIQVKNLGKVQKPVLMKLPMQWELSIQAKV